MKWLALVVLLAACRDDRAPECAATFSGNFAETVESPTSCATIVPGMATKLAVTVPSQKLDGPLVVEIELGPTPVAGRYSPAMVPHWSARGSWLNKACLLTGGRAELLEPFAFNRFEQAKPLPKSNAPFPWM